MFEFQEAVYPSSINPLKRVTWQRSEPVTIDLGDGRQLLAPQIGYFGYFDSKHLPALSQRLRQARFHDEELHFVITPHFVLLKDGVELKKGQVASKQALHDFLGEDYRKMRMGANFVKGRQVEDEVTPAAYTKPCTRQPSVKLH